MFDRLSERFDAVFKQLRGQGRITERNIDEALREIRRALLEADVNFKVTKGFIQQVKQRAIGREVLKSLTPGQQIIKIVHDELISLLGATASPLKLADLPPTTLMLVGLQGCGKTTIAGKLALHLKTQGRPCLLVAADMYRPAAVEQLQTLGASIDVPVYSRPRGTDPVAICQEGVEEGRRTNRSVVIMDTAGRLSIDQDMMDELVAIQRKTTPHEILFVADSMLGQDAVETASRFHQELEFSGCVLTKMDGDARGGAALSIRHVTGCPLKFIGTGEKSDAFEPFHPDRVVSRILGMGDMLSLIEKVEESIEQKDALEMQRKMLQNEFTLEDFRDQLRQFKKLGPLESILGMLPQMGPLKQLKNAEIDPKEVNRVEAILCSMTPKERRNHEIINGSRRRRIARGSGTTPQDINQLLNQFRQTQKLMRQLSRSRNPKTLMNLFR
jgi:signal recognition particle subunit SRP54